MAMQTTRRDGSPVVKPFAWSFTRLKNFEVCPKRHLECDVLKSYSDEENNTALLEGKVVHDALAARCSKGTPLPTGMEHYEVWAQKVLAGGGDIFVEQELAIDTNFGVAPWFEDRKNPTAPKPWFRSKVDFLKKQDEIALIVDWKTGKILNESFQLALSAACAFAKFPDLQAVRACYVWLKEDAESSETFLRTDMPTMWRTLWPRIEALKNAHQFQNYPPTPNRLCRSWCPVKACPNHGKSF